MVGDFSGGHWCFVLPSVLQHCWFTDRNNVQTSKPAVYLVDPVKTGITPEEVWLNKMVLL